jgi:putative addiction module component (TIGR02574 family)
LAISSTASGRTITRRIIAGTEEIRNLSFAQRQELVRRAIAPDEEDLTPEENALLDARMEDFRRNPEAGIPLEQLREHIAGRLSRQ